jgi:hypothetical protein
VDRVAGRPPRPSTVACPLRPSAIERLAFVAVVHTADFGSHQDAAGRLDGAFHWSILAEREVRARPLVVRDVGPKGSTKMPLIEDDDAVQSGERLAEWLSGPRGRWGIRDIDMQDTSPVVGQDHEDE